MAASVMEYVSRLDAIGDDIFTWINPNLAAEDRITQNFFGISHTFICAAMLIYTGLVFTFMPSEEAASKAAAREEQKGKNKGALMRLLGDWVLMLQFVYNLVQVSLSTYMFVMGLRAAIGVPTSMVCMGFDSTRDSIANILWVFYMSKMLDCCDTMFMLIRKKRKQVTFLHVYHHVGTMWVFWAALGAAYDGDIYVPVVLNSFVHIVMYGYYAITSLGVPVPLFIKSRVTTLQIVQFYTMLAHCCLLAIPQAKCEFPKNMNIVYGTHIGVLLVLFSLFFNQQYRAKKAQAAAKKFK